MGGIGAQERGDIGGARKLVVATFFDRFEMAATDAQALLDLSQVQTACLALIAQESTDCLAWSSLALNRPPVSLIRHSSSLLVPSRRVLAEAP